ncbi:MAG: putative metal-binding motif-containing protein [Myxococcota bacterium]
MKLALLLLFAACAPVDVDLDGLGKSDCDDNDARVGAGLTFYEDADADGFGDPATEMQSCGTPPGAVANSRDCDDGDPAVHPDAAEVCDAADVDEDCDGLADDDDGDVDDAGQVRAWKDSDGDGYGDGDTDGLFCDVPANYVLDATDCDDGDPGVTAAVTLYLDSDGDRYGDAGRLSEGCEPPPGYVTDGTDCDDAQADVNPSARELCDGEDDDCDGTVDEDDAVDAPTWYADLDEDGHGDAAASVVACAAPTGHVAVDDDCDDTSAAASPSRLEICDPADVDEDCDGLADDADPGAAAEGMGSWYADSDGDSFGDAGVGVLTCDAPVAYVADATDCDDAAALTNPAGTEVCDPDNADEDCDGRADDGDSSTDPASWISWYYDWDRDGYGSLTSIAVECDVGGGYVTTGGDCDDSVAAINPAGSEVCDAADADEDCDGLADDLDASVLASTQATFWRDGDGDSFGDPTSAVEACDVPVGYVADDLDCDAADPAIHPDAAEICGDLVDQNCDGSTDCVRDSSDAERKFVGEAANDTLGVRVASAGDQDGDGVDDLLLGAYGSDRGGTGSGAAYVIAGGGTGDLDVASAAVVLVGEQSGDFAGRCLGGVGDTNGDGYDDFIVGASSASGGGGWDAGTVYLLRGPQAGTVDLSSAYADFYGEATTGHAGDDCQGAGDVNGDGRPDFLVGVDSYSSYKGAAYLITSVPAGSTELYDATARVVGEGGEDYAGVSVDGAGDLDGDGYDDFLVGAYGDDDGGTQAGAAYVFYGPHSGFGSLTAADAKRTGDGASSYAGGLVRGVGDLDGDGHDDIAVGADSYGTDGIVYLVHGPIYGTASLALAEVRIEGTSGFVGRNVDGADLDADGHADVVLGNSGAGTTVSGEGQAYLMMGPLSGSLTTDDADLTFVGAVEDLALGAGLAFVGTQDGLGTYDLLVGAYGDAEGGSDAGAAYLFSLTGM